MGGMFDPVHLGHLQMAENARQLCALDEVRLIPCGNPVHRHPAQGSAEQRMQMLELAIENLPGLRVDARECRSAAPSYTFNTLSELRNENPAAVLYLLLGLDAFLALHTWYQWKELFNLAHCVVAGRPGYAFNEAHLDRELRAHASARLTTSCTDLAEASCGRVLLVTMATPPISSTGVRQLLRTGADTSNLLPPAVAEYIGNCGLYQ